jgi:hypothetical protein
MLFTPGGMRQAKAEGLRRGLSLFKALKVLLYFVAGREERDEDRVIVLAQSVEAPERSASRGGVVRISEEKVSEGEDLDLCSLV